MSARGYATRRLAVWAMIIGSTSPLACMAPAALVAGGVDRFLSGGH